MAFLIATTLSVLGASGALGEERLDATFSGDGTRQVSFVASGEDQAYDVATTLDDRVVVAGAAGGAMSVARLKVGGGLDGSFSSDGKLLVDLGGDDIAFAVARQGERLLLAGVKDGRAAVVRVRANGSLDGSFSGDGIRTQSIASHTPVAWTVVADGGSGRVDAAGYAFAGGSLQRAVVVRYRADGTLDETFSSDGIRLLPAADDRFVVDLAPQGKGRLLVLVRGSVSGSALLRLLPDGALDPAFGGGDGTVNLPSGSRPVALAVRAGRIVLLAHEGGASVLRRYLLAGNLDGAFGGGDGHLAIVDEQIGDTSPLDVAIQPGGAIVVAAANGDLQAFRVTSAGVLDGTFNGTIPVVELGGAGDDEIAGIAVDGLGRIVLAGTLELGAGQADPFIARMVAD